jgi:ligand-binding SRPBCC domain-containing protein
MTTHKLHLTMALPLAIEDVFAFFANIGHLEQVTPPDLQFEVLTPQPVQLTAGTTLDYRLRLFGFPFFWRSRILEWNPPWHFVDEQISGPYRLWRHTHRFAQNNGLTSMSDDIHYRLPLGPIGELAYPVVRGKLQEIFRYREQAIQSALLDSEHLS